MRQQRAPCLSRQCASILTAGTQLRTAPVYVRACTCPVGYLSTLRLTESTHVLCKCQRAALLGHLWSSKSIANPPINVGCVAHTCTACFAVAATPAGRELTIGGSRSWWCLCECPARQAAAYEHLPSHLHIACYDNQLLCAQAVLMLSLTGITAQQQQQRPLSA
jgi:hypothetical protein